MIKDYSYNCPPEQTACPSSIIDQQLALLADRLGVLLAEVSEIESRIATVLRMGDKQPARDNKITGGTGVPLGDALASLTARAQEAIDRLNMIQERIAL